MFLEETPQLRATGNEKLEADCVYTLRVGACDGRQQPIASAMIAVHEQGADVLWSSA